MSQGKKEAGVGAIRPALAPAGSPLELATGEAMVVRTQGLKAESKQEELGLTVVILWKRSV